jgi:tRNA pseudouridine55 synthase
VPQRPHEESSDAAGIVNLYKPVGKSSANYVYRLRPIFGLRKVGHAGTLDPFADGVCSPVSARARGSSSG